jgi:hypothetical protein
VTKGFAIGGAAFGCVSDVFDNSSGRGRGGLEATLVTSAKFLECDLEKQSVSGYDNLMIMINMVTKVLSLNLYDEVATSSAVRFLCGAVDTLCLWFFLDIADSFLLDMVIVPRRVVLSRKVHRLPVVLT